MKNTLVAILIIAILAGAGFYFFRGVSTQTQKTSVLGEQSAAPVPQAATTSTEEQVLPAPPSGQILNLAAIFAHAVPTDCWMAIDGKVYNLTDYVVKGLHPGGDAIKKGCGKDATAMFNSVPKHIKANAIKDAQPYYMGDLVN